MGHTMLLQAPFQLPPGFLSAFGYPGGRRLVALYWEPSGDEACFDDGASFACGLCDNWLYLGFIRQPHVSQWLNDNGLNLGNSDEPAQHWLIADTLTSALYAATCREAYSVVHCQQLPGDG
jgi:hypothetical protein